MNLSVHYLPQFVAEADLAESVVVIVDLLRASTTICQALAAGAKCVVPSVEVDETFAKAADFSRDEILLGGERGGQQIEGFDLGNSPAEYTADQVFDRTVLFTTTNGTKALAHARLAQRILIGATVNRQAIVDTLANARQVDILCAGTGGKVTREDILAAGAMVHSLTTTSHQLHTTPYTTNEWAEAASREWQELLTTARAFNRTTSQQFALELRDTLGGKNLLVIGHDDDLVFCARLDTHDVVPELDQTTGHIRLL